MSGQKVLDLELYYTYLRTTSNMTSHIQMSKFDLKSKLELMNIFFDKLVLDHKFLEFTY